MKPQALVLALLIAACSKPAAQPVAPRSAAVPPDDLSDSEEPIRIWLCCPEGKKCTDVDDDVTRCKFPDRLVWCCGPSTAPDGTITCGC